MRNSIKGSREGSVLKGNIKVLAIMSILFGAYFSIFFAVWQPFVISLGASMTFLGFLQSLWGWHGIVPSIFGPIGGWASDRLGRKPFLMFGASMIMIALFFYCLAWAMGNYLILIPGAIAMGLGGISWAARDSAIAESVEREKWGRAYSMINFFGLMPGIFLPLAGGYVAERIGFGAVFLIAMAMQGGYLAIAFLRLRETMRRSIKRLALLLRELKKSLRRIFIPPANLRTLYLVMAFDAFSWGLGSMILYGMLVKTYGFTVFQIGILSGIFNISWVATQLPMGKLVDKYGSKALLLASEVVGIMTIAGWLLSKEFLVFAMLAIFYGIVASAWVPAMQTMFASCADPAELGEVMGRLSAFQGTAGFSAPLIGGILYDRLGFWAPVSANLVGALITAALIAVKIHVRTLKEF